MNTQLSCRRAGLAFGLLLTLTLAAHAQISSTSGDVIAIPQATIIAVGSLQDGDFTHDSEIRVILEKETVTLASNMDTDVTADGVYNMPLTPGIIAAGEVVSSVIVHADRASAGGTSALLGTIEFSARILGVVLADDTLDDWDPVVGLPGVVYPTGLVHRGMEVDDAMFPNPDEITLAGRTLTLDLKTSGWTDQLRVILAATGRGVSFSFDAQGPSQGAPDGFSGAPMFAGDILTVGDGGAPGPNPPVLGPVLQPGILIARPALSFGLGPYGVGELDALSYGRDGGNRLRFSVDEFAVGSMAGPFPDVRSEGAFGNDEASADVFAFLAPLASTPPSVTPGNRAVLDGNGFAPTSRPGFGLVEPNPETVVALPDSGDNLDALDLGTTAADVAGRVYFSLDATFVDWAEAYTPPPNYGTAAASGVSAADILVTIPGSGALAVYASALALGLDCGGDCEDDIDALAVWDDGDGEWEPGTDEILFSLRRGSGSIGTVVPPFGLELCEADVLIPGPRILIAGESLGLNTCRSTWVPPTQVWDDIDALDRVSSRGAPVANPDEIGFDIGQDVWIDVLANDVAMVGSLLPASVTVLRQPEYGTILEVNPQTGAIHYQHGGAGVEDWFTYLVFDDRGEFSETARVLLIGGLNPVPDGPGGEMSVFSCMGPNPFQVATAFAFRPTLTGLATVAVYDLAGRRVRVLLDEPVLAGEVRRVAWDGRDGSGQSVAAGLYFVRARCADGDRTATVVRAR